MLTNSQNLIGQALGTCTLRRLIGRGGMGAVYLAQQSRPRRTVAVKVLLPHLVEDHPREEFLARFRREADAIAALDHVNIMPVYEYGEQGETAYLVMPYVTGGTLRERLEKRPIPPLEETMQIIEQAAAGLDSAHAQGIIHRDLKPGNILFHADGRVLLADFGLAKVLKETAEDSGVSVVTSTGTIVGTPEYLSPEQGSGEQLDYRTDVYSLGVVLYQMLAGRVPFVGPSPVAVAIKHTLEPPPPITRFNPQVPHSVEAVVMKALMKRPEERFSSAGEMARALRQAAAAEQPTFIWQATPSQKLPTASTPAVVRPDVSTAEVGYGEEKDGDADTGEGQKQAVAAEGHAPDRAQAPSLQEQVAALPTMFMPAGGDDPHAAPTEEGPPVPVAEHSPAHPHAAVTTADMTTVEPQPPEPEPIEQHSPSPAQSAQVMMEARVLADQRRVMAPPLQRPEVQVRPYAQSPGGPQRPGADRKPLQILLIGSLVVLVVVVGSLFVYLQGLSNGGPQANGTNGTPQGKQQGGQTQVQTTSTPGQQGTPVPTTDPSKLPAPRDGIAHGALVYGSAQPMCNPLEGSWKKLGPGTAECANGLHIANSGSNRTGVFLEGKPIPNDFTLQVQVTINPGSTGGFGIFYRSQADDHWKSYVYMIEPRGGGWTWTAYVYKDGQPECLNCTPVSTLTPIEGTITVAMNIVSSDFGFYINDQKFDQSSGGGAQSGGQYPGGTIGFAADPGANVTFKNLAVYALS